ncbi:MAG: glycolate oxidase iron-sulfur subunit [Ferrovum sp. 37-45-19]|uniref:glycolate oxidase subunit GlcF n=1 Tax=Ferrovum sp. JA12 TaxID=1356299 RepID=UPI00070307BB|nr:glycolate oxidase subunit GlcF [Ferrovum sp. JA12]OYV79042.1 MAG: glycolate oxidase iron-sulfur subunit [Ferrovum sp. 21-44-67]OYV93805.1 MAG: glycolate oxidase iron-sulfur subunit [Ferrovum sp. 37-45-19]HQT82121.1 glycolate oxidase subunit GlcF [Ferrovaceae bacterium]KRH78611.1 lactate utilization protein A [Ferrovum sp. JA12]HQU07169.1 glycolate oxidase subunit GlcF [Ferrovaceae bacterium]
MYVNLTPEFKAADFGEEAEKILRTCVHCGFCLATCPTYQLLGNELDSPRGRIYLIKNVLEGEPVTKNTQLHLDRCLTCRACESTCPSGVQYGKLVDIGRKVVEKSVPRSAVAQFKRYVLKKVLPNPKLFNPLVDVGQAFKPLLPKTMTQALPDKTFLGLWPTRMHARKMIVLEGCVQPKLTPETNLAAAKVLDQLGISLIRVAGSGCCGALKHHLNDEAAALMDMRRNIDFWWPQVEKGGVEAIVVTASGCGTEVKQYGYHLQHDPLYSDRAQQISHLARDISEVMAMLPVESLLKAQSTDEKIAFHAPCSLQHGQKLKGFVEGLLTGWGARLTTVPDAHLCCGSAGTYSILQPEISKKLQANKIKALESGRPDVILTANIGCQTHLKAVSSVPVIHWIEWLAAKLEL